MYLRLKMKRASALFCMLMLCLVSVAQVKTITGQVSDATGEPVIGATVFVKGSTSNGVITDIDGNFSLSNVNSTDVLQVQFLGYTPQEITVGEKSQIFVKLREDNNELEDVVVVGYGTMKKKDLTGSVATVKGDALTKVPVPNIAEALTGKLPGVRVTTSDGSPDAEIVIRVRGGGSITSDNTPLYIVDGFPTESISDISSNDIEDITVLRDASSTAIYGSRGANGVILITTKGAKSGKSRVNYNGFLQTKRIANRLEAMNTYDYIMSNYEYAMLRGSDDVANFEKNFGVYDDFDIYKSMDAIDWQDDMFGANVITQSHNVSVSGGTEKTMYSLSGTYDYNGGLMPNNDYQRLSVSFKLNHQINKNVKLGLNARISDQEVNGSGTQGGTYKIRTSQAVTSVATNGLSGFVTPDFSSMSDDEYQEYLNSTMTLAEQAARYWRKREQRRFQFNASLDWKIIEGLTLHGEGGYTYGFNDTKNWWGATTTNASYEGGMPLAEWQKQNSTRVRGSAHLTYDFKLGRDDSHRFSIMAGTEYGSNASAYNQMHGSKFSKSYTPEQVFDNFSKGGGTPTIKSYTSPNDNLVSFFGRINYNFNERYLLTLTAREDGSSKFLSEDNRHWGFFPAAAFAWRVLEEDWMQPAKDWMSNLKLRVSYGTAGNDNIKSDAAFRLYSVDSGSKRYGVGDVENHHYVSGTTIANPLLTWESMITRNIGIDFGFFDERINGTVDFYWNSTKDLLVEHTITAPGYTKVYENSGKTTNKGVELALNASIVRKPNFTLDANFNIGFNKGEIDKLKGDLQSMPFPSGWAGTDNKNQEDYIAKVGQPIGMIYGWICDGYYTTDDFESYDPVTKKYTLKEGQADATALLGGQIGTRPGTIKLRDISGADGVPDGVVDSYDRTIIGDTNPICQGGFGFSGTFLRDFDFTANFTYSIGNDVYNANKIASSQQYRSGSYPNMLNDFRPSNAYSYLNPQTGELLTTLEELAYWNEGANAKEYWSPYSFGSAVVVPTSWAMEDASFLRLQSLTLGYTLPKALTTKVGVQNCRFYVTATNLFCLTNYSGYDPEVSTYARNSSYSGLTPGIDYSSYPKSRGWTFGLNVTL